MSGAGPSAGVRVFISYSSVDRDLVDPLKERLKQAGADVWLDHERLTPDTLDWREALRKGIVQATHLIYAGSETAAVSRYVAHEMALAEDNNKTIIGLWVRGEKWSGCAPIGYYNMQRIDARGDAFNTGVKDLLDTLGLPESGPPPPAQVEIPERMVGLGFRGMKPQGTPAIIPPLITIPAGAFIMGSDKAKDEKAQENETPPHGVELAVYRIARYPVTVAEYALALNAGAVREPPKAHEVTWAAQARRPDHPVVCVSWQDATNYARWLASVTGQPWRLPSEAEWEKAARWDALRGSSDIYPWGDTFDKYRCNTHESGVHSTTPVGCYTPAEGRRSGASPYGVEDMVGNVWEWTASVFRSYQEAAGDGREDASVDGARTLRGGSWSNEANVARAACRIGGRPDVFLRNVGFRLATSA